MLKEWNYGPLYTPPARKKTILVPGWVGGASWAGAAADPETGLLYVPSVTNPMWLDLRKPTGPGANLDLKIGESGYRVPGPRGLPLLKPPYGRITAIDLNTGRHAWMIPHGEGPRNHPALRGLHPGPLGSFHRGYVLVTKTLLLGIKEGSWFNEEAPSEPPKLRAFDKSTGRLIAEVDIPGCATGAPITYMAGGRQYIAVPTGGQSQPAKLFALRLP